MGTLRYAKNCIQHDAVKHVKRELNKIERKYNNSDMAFHFELTGVERWDAQSVQFRICWAYDKLAASIKGDIDDNRIEYAGWRTRHHVNYLNWIQEVQAVLSYIRQHYRDFENKQQPM